MQDLGPLCKGPKWSSLPSWFTLFRAPDESQSKNPPLESSPPSISIFELETILSVYKGIQTNINVQKMQLCHPLHTLRYSMTVSWCPFLSIKLFKVSKCCPTPRPCCTKWMLSPLLLWYLTVWSCAHTALWESMRSYHKSFQNCQMPRILDLSWGVPFPVGTPDNISGWISVVLWLLRWEVIKKNSGNFS